jgi:hypothetical protein
MSVTRHLYPRTPSSINSTQFASSGLPQLLQPEGGKQLKKKGKNNTFAITVFLKIPLTAYPYHSEECKVQRKRKN